MAVDGAKAEALDALVEHILPSGVSSGGGATSGGGGGGDGASMAKPKKRPEPLVPPRGGATGDDVDGLEAAFSKPFAWFHNDNTPFKGAVDRELSLARGQPVPATPLPLPKGEVGGEVRGEAGAKDMSEIRSRIFGHSSVFGR